MLLTPWFRSFQETIARTLSRGQTARRQSRRRMVSSRPELLDDRIVPAIITVTSAADNFPSNTGDGQVTLREALEAANNDSSVDGSTAGFGADNIVFAANLTGPITLAGHELTINSFVTIEGPGASQMTISGNNASRIFSITNTNTASISGLALVDGTSSPGTGGGCIFNGGTLTLNNCMISGNTSDTLGGAIVNGTSLTIKNSTISENTVTGGLGIGGGIWNGGGSILQIRNSTLTGNSTINDGGAIWCDGSVTIDNSSLTGNYAGGSGGAIECWNGLLLNQSTVAGNLATVGGGALDIFSGFVAIQSSTISGNTVESTGGGSNGGGINNAGQLTIVSSTIVDNTVTGNGGGIVNNAPGTTSLQNTIVANNDATGLGDDLNGKFSAEYSLVERRFGATFHETTPGTNKYGIDPLLGPLADNGGPTLTHALLPGSPCINRGSNPGPFAGMPAPGFDQRGLGYVRAVGRPDMGAVEVQQKGAYLVRDMNNGANRQLVVVGSQNNDTITVTVGAGNITVLNGQTQFFASANVVGIVVMGYDGNDTITVANTAQAAGINTLLNGGAGDDIITGAGANDILVGGLGNDRLFGMVGKDILIGGDGHDFVVGGAGDDLMINGATLYDNTPTALFDIRTEWTTSPFLTAVANLRKGLMGAPIVDASTISDGFYDDYTVDAGTELVFRDGFDAQIGALSLGDTIVPV